MLDWLAVEFRESGWDVKRFFKMLVTSSTYRQAAATTPEKREKDPSNRLLSRAPERRKQDRALVMVRVRLAIAALQVPRTGALH